MLIASLTNNHFFSSAHSMLVAVQMTTAFTQKAINLVLRLMCYFYNKISFLQTGQSFFKPKHLLRVNFSCCPKVISLWRYLKQIKKCCWSTYYWPFLIIMYCLVLLSDGQRDPGCIFLHYVGGSAGLGTWSSLLRIIPVSTLALEQALSFSEKLVQCCTVVSWHSQVLHLSTC